MGTNHILAIDQGTTSTRAVLFDAKGATVKTAQKELTLHYPHKGWVEQTPSDIWNDTKALCKDVLSNSMADVIGITNQRETTIVWDRKTGEAIYNAIVWQDRRTADYCAELKAQGHEDAVQDKTGLLLDPYFSATKIKWILDNIEGARTRAENGELAFGTIDCFLLWKLTEGKSHTTDATNAARTMLYNIQEQCWDKDLLTLFDIPENLLPDVKDNVADFGQTALFGSAIPIGGMAGDQHAALIGQTCFEKGMVKSTYGTGCFLVMNIGDTFITSKNKLLTTIAYRLNGKVTYAIEGSIFVAGAAIQWLRDNLEFFADAKDSETMAFEANAQHGVYFIPAFTGLGAPYWNPYAKAMICGLTRENTKNDITRAALEAQAYQTLDLMDAIKDDTGFDPAIMRVDGGLVKNEFVCQFLADMLGRSVEVPAYSETTVQGAAYLAGLYTGHYKSLSELSDKWEADRQYSSKMDNNEKDALYAGWKEAIEPLTRAGK